MNRPPMNRHRAVTLAQLPQFILDWEAPMPTRDMASKYHCTGDTITNTARRLDLPHRPTGRPRTIPRSPDTLPDGTWVNHHGTQVWTPTHP